MQVESEILKTGSVTEVPDDVMRLAEALSRIHGQLTVALESGGLHLYMASPAKLAKSGDKELISRHLAVNADKFYGRGQWEAQQGMYDAQLSAMCMSTSKPCTVTELLGMPPLAERGIKPTAEGVKFQNTQPYLVSDGRGNMVPKGPGDMIKPTDFPALCPLKAKESNQPR